MNEWNDLEEKMYEEATRDALEAIAEMQKLAEREILRVKAKKAAEEVQKNV